jgi:nitrite reductase/ring-hydroxylating ferredoxin subunit
VIVAKVGGEFHAFSGKCPHYNLPLAMGMLDGYDVICPFHSAAFDIRTGEQ